MPSTAPRGAEQLAELRLDLGSEVAAPRVHVLTEQRDLLDAVSSEARHLGDHLTRAAAALAAADSGDDAVGADRVAAHRDLHPGLERALAAHRQARRELALVEAEPAPRDALASRAEPVREMRDRAGPEGDVDVRVELEDPLALRLGIAAADRNDAAGVAPLASRGLAEVCRELRVGLLPDRAGVEDDDVGVLGRRGLPRPSSSSMPLMRSESCAFIWQPNVVTWYRFTAPA